MMQPIATSDDYLMGRTKAEHDRLRQQALMWEAATARLLRDAGLRAGMSCLDVGCGPGSVMKLMGEIVGSSGSVTGLDLDSDLGWEMLQDLRGTSQCRFGFSR